ncbi:MAG: TlpA family protein disulfide reductase [Candidatus Binatia bacterium]
MYSVRRLPWICGLVLLASTALAGPPVPAGAPSLIRATAPDLLAAVRAPGAAATLVNVWATWCIPCREEFGDLLRLRAAYADRGLRVLFVSGDFDSERAQVEAFLRDHGVSFVTYLKTGDDMQFIDALDPQWTGALPATFIYDRQGTRRQSLFGKSSYAALEELVNGALADSASTAK